MSDTPCILFTAFEPSGDDHAAPVIAELKRLRPDIPIYALGGKRMAQAGAIIIAQTCGRGTMFLDSLGEIFRHAKYMRILNKWMKTHRVTVHVPTDSPAANWGICKKIKNKYANPCDGKVPAKVIHLVSPQIWAWAQWRVKRLIKWSDLVLCILPFEPAWLMARGVKARFIGHPILDKPLDYDAMATEISQFPQSDVKLAMLPGSRPSEIKKNWPDQLEVLKRLSKKMPQLQAMVASVHANSTKRIQSLTEDWPDNLTIIEGQYDDVIQWCDVALACSGTVTLHVARHKKPMVIVYRTGKWAWHLAGRWLVSARTFSLINLIAGDSPNPDPKKHIVKEFAPFWGDVQPLVDEIESLITDEEKRAIQLRGLEKVINCFTSHHAGSEAANAILEVIRDAQAGQT